MFRCGEIILTEEENVYVMTIGVKGNRKKAFERLADHLL